MPLATLDDIQTSAQPWKSPGCAIVRKTSDEDAEMEVVDFIVRCILETDAQFFDG